MTQTQGNEPIHEGVSWLRWADRKVLLDLKRIVILHKGGKKGEPLAVVVPYDAYLTIQDCLRQLAKAHDEKLI